MRCVILEKQNVLHHPCLCFICHSEFVIRKTGFPSEKVSAGGVSCPLHTSRRLHTFRHPNGPKIELAIEELNNIVTFKQLVHIEPTWYLPYSLRVYLTFRTNLVTQLHIKKFPQMEANGNAPSNWSKLSSFFPWMSFSFLQMLWNAALIKYPQNEHPGPDALHLMINLIPGRLLKHLAHSVCSFLS